MAGHSVRSVGDIYSILIAGACFAVLYVSLWAIGKVR